MAVINIRGTNGAGKSHMVRGFIEQFNGKPIAYDNSGRKSKVLAYQLETKSPAFVIGRYDVACGGADTMPKPTDRPDWNCMDVVEQTVRQYALLGHVIFEGLIVSSVWNVRWVNLARDFPAIFLFLDTPMEVCRQRVGERNGGKLLKNEELGLEKTHLGLVYRRCQTHLRRAQAAGLNVLVVNYERAYETIQEQLLSA